MRRRAITVAALASTLALAWAGVAGPTAAATVWTRVPSPNIGTLANALASVSALSASEAWAVGVRQIEGSGDFATLAEHWDGTAWTVQTSPNVGLTDRLSGVAELAADNAWTVGNFFNLSTLAYQTLIEHWDGSAWTIVPSPNVGTRYDALQAVAGTGPSDVWAVGATQTNPPTIRNLPLIEHFNGTAWSVVPTPKLTTQTSAQLLGVAATSPTDASAVGFNDSATIAEHWNGSKWSVVSTPNRVDTGANVLTAVTAVGSSDVWAVGDSQPAGGVARTLTEHFDGTSWSIVHSPNHGILNNSLAGVSSLSSSDVWTVGIFVQVNTGLNRTLTEHFDGTRWRLVSSPNPGTDNVLSGTATAGPSTVWAVGGFENKLTFAENTLTLENTQG